MTTHHDELVEDDVPLASYVSLVASSGGAAG
jgi:hypothetical protein